MWKVATVAEHTEIGRWVPPSIGRPGLGRPVKGAFPPTSGEIECEIEARINDYISPLLTLSLLHIEIMLDAGASEVWRRVGWGQASGASSGVVTTPPPLTNPIRQLGVS